MKDLGRGFSHLRADLFQILCAVIHAERRVIIFVFFLFLPFSALAQTNLDDLRNKIAVGSTEEKRNALFEIRTLHTEEASRIAIPALSDQIEIVRATAASAVIFLPSDEALKLLLPLLNDDAEFVRLETAFALGRLGNPAAATALISDLQTEDSVENRSAAIIALGKLGNPDAVEPLTTILRAKRKEPEGFVRGAAARSIGEIAQTIKFGKHQTTTPESFLPDKYKTALGKNANKLPNVFDAAIPVLTIVLQNKRESNDARRESAFALGAIGSPDSLSLLKTCANSQDYYLAEICKEGSLKTVTVR